MQYALYGEGFYIGSLRPENILEIKNISEMFLFLLAGLSKLCL
jgi:hypothetical protein